MSPVLLAHAEGDSALAEKVADPLRAAGYEVLYEGTVLVGDSLIKEASSALGAGSPVVLCGTVAAMGTGWAHQVVNAARAYPGTRVFALQMEKNAYLQPLSLDGRVARYWQDPGKAIDELLAALREYYPPPSPPRRAPADDALRRYCELALRTNDIVDLANLPVTDRHLATRELLLRSLYVGLRVAVDPALATEGASAPRRGPRSSLDDPRSSAREHPAGRWPVGELLAQSWRLVVLGDPGAGKSTLLRWLATAYLLRLADHPDWRQLPDIAQLPNADWLPILVRCRDLEDPDAGASLEQILDHHLRKLGIAAADTRELTGLLLGRLAAGTAILLIDGLDEITRPAARARFCRQIEQVHVAFPDAAIIVTSRIVGYREMGLRVGRGFEHVTVLDLTAVDKDEFISKWCAVTELPTRSAAAQAELVKDIHSTDRIERLTGNPMLLTTMALVKKKVGKLPSRRADLYREAVDVLLNWRSDVDELLDPYEAMPQLEYLAYAMCAAGVQQLRADEITTLLAAMRREFASIRPVRRHSPEEFLQLLERRTGILVEVGKVRHQGRLVPAYEFRHLTFQEYLAGLALTEGRFPGRDRSRSLADYVSLLAAQTSHAGLGVRSELTVSENWREALRLCVVLCNDDDVDSVLKAIADVRADEDASVTARPRAVLALSCLSDEPNVSEHIAYDLMDDFARVLRDADDEPGGTTAARAVGEVSSSSWAPALTRRLVMAWLAAPGDQIWLAALAADASRELRPDDGDSLRRWLTQRASLLSGADQAERICAALEVMQAAYEARIGSRSALVMVPRLGTGLMAMLRQPGREAEAAAWAITWLARTGNSLTSSAPWTLSARQKATLITHIKSPQVSLWTSRFLLGGLTGDYSHDHSFACVVAALLADSEDPNWTKTIDRVYLRLFPACPDPIFPLTSHTSAHVRLAAAQLLGRMSDTRATEPLISELTGPDGQVRDTVADALGQLGDTRATEPLIGALVRPDGQVRPSVAAALSRLGDPAGVRQLQCLMHGPSPADRTATCWALASCEPERLHRMLLSRDANGALPSIDPDEEITDDHVRRYAIATEQTPEQIRSAYEQLRDKYLLRLAWQSPPSH